MVQPHSQPLARWQHLCLPVLAGQARAALAQASCHCVASLPACPWCSSKGLSLVFFQGHPGGVWISVATLRVGRFGDTTSRVGFRAARVPVRVSPERSVGDKPVSAGRRSRSIPVGHESSSRRSRTLLLRTHAQKTSMELLRLARALLGQLRGLL